MDIPQPYVDRDEETVVQRTRRRIAQGKCPACAAHLKNRSRILCEACHQTKKYCPRCEAVQYRAIFTDNASTHDGKEWCCPTCRMAMRSSEPWRLTDQQRYRARKQALGKTPRTMDEIYALQDRIAKLVKKGMDMHEVADQLGLSYHATRGKYYSWKKRHGKRKR